jgi:Na+/melibiose symporter and related transporters
MEGNGKIACPTTSDAVIDKSMRVAIEGGEQILNQKYLSKGEYVSMCLANFIFALANGLTKTYLLTFYLLVLCVDAGTVAIMFLITKIFDALNDPIMGTIIDKTRSKWGKMRPYLIFSSVPFGIVIILMFISVKELPFASKAVLDVLHLRSV